MQANNSINWIEESISKNHIKYYEYKYFNNIQEIGTGCFGKELIHELELHRDVDFHDNVIRFYGITEDRNYKMMKNYLLVMEYANGACAVSCLHDEGIIHRDLHSGNVLIHQNTIKLADFETPISNTPDDYVNIYTACWNSEPEDRPTIIEVIQKLKSVIPKSNMLTISNTSRQILNENSTLYSINYSSNGSSQIIRDLEMRNTESTKISEELTFKRKIIDEIVNLIFKEIDKEKNQEIGIHILNNLNNGIKLPEIYDCNW
ncbi:unnamed protein product [Rhizophagus irregularis]|nr:unnamed protein product [Rhizophagus irregularis]